MTVLLCAVTIPYIEAGKPQNTKARASSRGGISVYVAPQAFCITDKTLYLHYSVVSGQPDQIRLQPTRETKNMGMNAVVEWMNVNYLKDSILAIPRPAEIKPGDYEFQLQMRNTAVSRKITTTPIVISIYQIDFDIDPSIITCDNERFVQAEIRNIIGNPNIIRLSASESTGIQSTEWRPFNAKYPFMDIDISNISSDIITISDDKSITIELADSTTGNYTSQISYQPVYRTTDSVVIDYANARYIHEGDEIEEYKYLDTTYIVGSQTYFKKPADGRYDKMEVTTYTETVYAEKDTTIYPLRIVAHAGEILRYDTTYRYSRYDGFRAYQTHSPMQIGHGTSKQYVGVKLNGSMVYVDDNDKSAFASYQWYKDGEKMQGATERVYFESDANGNMQPLNGTFYVEATTRNGEIQTLCPVTLYGQTDNSKQQRSRINPNPASKNTASILHINTTQEKLEETVMRIYDTAGNLAYISVGLQEENEMPLLPANEYIIFVEMPDYTETLKYIVK